MRSCEQMKDLNVLEHGLMVARYFEDLRGHILEGKDLKYEWRLPDWVDSPALWNNLLDLKTVRTYQIYHDCGKPFCRTVDEDGRQHFPDHARVSEDLWASLMGEGSVSRLIGLDMAIHTMKAVECEDFAKREEAATLVLTGLAEIHANASMFGGIESVSFKSKWKHIQRRGKKIVGLLES